MTTFNEAEMKKFADQIFAFVMDYPLIQIKARRHKYGKF